MRLRPQKQQQLGNPAIDRAQPVDPGVAAGAKRNHPGGVFHGQPVVHDDVVRSGADPALVAIARQHFLPPASEPVEGVPARTIARETEPSLLRRSGTAGAKRLEEQERLGSHGS